MSDLISRQAAIERIDEALARVFKEPCGELILRKVPSAEPEQRWIPCSERLPEYGEGVLTINEDEDYEVNHIIDEDSGEWFYEGAIAWMPLPEPYKGG